MQWTSEYIIPLTVLLEREIRLRKTPVSTVTGKVWWVCLKLFVFAEGFSLLKTILISGRKKPSETGENFSKDFSRCSMKSPWKQMNKQMPEFDWGVNDLTWKTTTQFAEGCNIQPTLCASWGLFEARCSVLHAMPRTVITPCLEGSTEEQTGFM